MNKDVPMLGKTIRKIVNGAGKSFSQNGKSNHAVLKIVPQLITVCKGDMI